ncbi:glycosyl hydrolase family 17 protein [Phnomibacter sp. MR]|uniref:glycoside hydrolase family 17 protein n=1 Tax=Phnomibacter sp. MR TaxID=3042318 RepID=UPI003A80F5BA
MNFFSKYHLPPGNAICYSGFRQGQQPGGIYPSYDEVKEDLLILQEDWSYIRLYDCDKHSITVLNVIEQEGLPFKVMLGAYIEAEMNNFGCPWGGGVYTQEQLIANQKSNAAKIEKLIQLANTYSDIVIASSVGNEACVDWTDHFVPVQQVIQYVQRVKSMTKQPVTFCENYVPWLVNLDALAEVVDFISIHTYPVWEYKHIHESIGYTKDNYYSVAQKYPHKPVIITEAGWSTNSNGRGINPEAVNEENQKTYVNDLLEWTTKESILTFVFEAFDEDWKGSPEPLEPEKHWGLFKIDRTPKLVMQKTVAVS